MDPNQQPQAEKDTQPKPVPVMDIQPPRPATAPVVAEGEPKPVVQQEAEPEIPAVDPEPVAATVTNEDSSQETVADSPTEVVETKVQENEDEPKLEQTLPEQSTLAAAPKPPKHSRTPVLAIAIAVIIAGAFGAFAVLAYRDSQKPVPASQKPVVVEEQQSATPSDVDETVTELDEALNSADEAADFDDNSLSDTSLEL